MLSSIPSMPAKKTRSWGGQRRGAGRKPLVKDPIRLTARIEREEMEQLEELAEDEGISVSQLVRRLIRQHLRRRGSR